ncbi:DNA topoisomerase [Acinetobacter sp. P1(2025)]|uniref:DNA topoisomerase n=1 Tax=Acinetobacter sp. P1(2025) TaxID=3446120 RepID=UPI003F530B59
MKLIIAEKPSVAEEIAKALGGFTKSQSKTFFTNNTDCLISWSRGHVVHLTHNIPNNINLLPVIPKDDEWSLEVITSKGSQDIFNNLKTLIEHPKVTEVINACDAGREGEYIFRLIYAKVGSDKPIKRMWIQSMRKEALVEAFKKVRPASEYEGLNKAAWNRSKADWIVGLNGSVAASQVLSKKSGDSTRVALGRVKTPVLSLVVAKQREIDNFVPEPFWEIFAEFEAKGIKYKGKWVNYTELNKTKAKEDADDSEEDERSSNTRFWDRAKALEVIAKCHNGDICKAVTDVKETQVAKTIRPPNLFDLGSIQTLANKMYKFDTNKTLELVQKLYEEHKAVTYPRTDSTHLPEDYESECQRILGELAKEKEGTSPIPVLADKAKERAKVSIVGKHVFDNAKVSDHFAIIPTGIIPHLADADLKKIYYLIVKRFKEAFLPPVKYNQTDRFTFIDDVAFRTVGKVITDKGWQELGELLGESKASNSEDKEGDTLPSFDSPQDIKTKNVSLEERTTTPPLPYTQGTLLNAMKYISRSLKGDQKNILKSCGIGTPATRSNIIAELLANDENSTRQALIKEVGKNKELAPTDLGSQIIDFLMENNLDALTQPEFTADWEMMLDDVRNDVTKSQIFVDHTNSVVTEFVNKFKQMYSDIPSMKLQGALCPVCDSELNLEARHVKCSSINCKFQILRIVAQRKIEDTDLQILINNKVTHVLNGFHRKPKEGEKKKANDQFSAALKLVEDENGQYQVQFYYPRDEYEAPCPFCESKMVSTINGISCENKECGIVFWAVRFKKKLSDRDQLDLITKGKTKVIAGFVSSKGTPFSASLVLNKAEKKVDLEFAKNADKVETDLKCVSTANCEGKYVRTGTRYACSVCDHYFFSGIKGGDPLNESQIKSVLSGKTITHVAPIFDIDGSKSGTKKIEVFFDKGRIQIRDKVKEKS